MKSVPLERIIKHKCNNHVAGVVIPPGYIETVADNNQQTEAGDGGPAVNASLDGPTGVAVDITGNICVSDLGGNRIRAINTGAQSTTIATIQIPPGYIQTIAGLGSGCPGGDSFGSGCLAIKAIFSAPAAVALDTSGNIYVSDAGHHQVREVSASTGYISDVAGDGTGGYFGDGEPAINAELGNPQQIAIDGAGNIYIADASENRIREVSAATGLISTVAGDGIGGYLGDGGSATAAELKFPSGIAVDGSNNLYIGDTDNNRVRVVGAQAVIVSMTPTSLRTGTQVTFTGSGFGKTQGSGGWVTFNNLLAASIVSWSNTQVIATVAFGTAGGLAYVAQNGVRSNGIRFTMVPPTLTSISPTSLSTGTSVTLTGSGFGAIQGASGWVTFNNQTAATIVSWSDTQVVATVAPGTFGGFAYVAQNYVRSNGLIFNMTPPNLNSISPTSVSVGTQVTFTGTGFGAAQGLGYVTFNNEAAASIVSWSDTTVVATVASGTTGGLAYVTQNGVSQQRPELQCSLIQW